MTSRDITTISLALLGAVITLLVNWAVLRGDHAGLKRIVLLNDAIRDLPEHSPGRHGLTMTRDELAVRAALRMYPADGGIADVLRSLSRLFVAVSIGLFVFLLGYVVLR